MMRSLFWKITIGLVVSIALSISWIIMSNKIFPSIRRMDMATWVVSCWGVFGTFSAVVIALFGKSIFRYFNKPILIFNIAKDKSHCYYKEETQVEPDVKIVKLEIYGRVTNEMSIVATNCQAVCNVAYVSTSGHSDYSPLHQFCTASFKWVNSRSYEITLRKSMDRYLKLIEIIEKETERQNGPDEKKSKKKERVTTICLCIPSFCASTDMIEIGGGYKGIMFPIQIICDELVKDVVYVQVVWQGEKLSDYNVADKLKICKLTETEAKNLMAS